MYRKGSKMKDCLVSWPWESPFPFMVVLACFILSFVYTVNGSGAYTNVFRAARRNLTKNGPPSSFTDFGVNAQIPPIRDNPHLEVIDERFSTCNGIDIREITIHQLQEHFANNRLSSVELTNCYIKRIEELNKVLKAVIEINPEATADALRADIERSSGKGDLDPMHGIPVLIKENIATNDMMGTTAGSLALAGIRPKDDADVVKTLRRSGAVIIGKANLSEFAYFRGTNIPSGWSGKGGYTRNAYNMNESPEGSSSGSAVAVSANLVMVSIGTETDGSLIAPSSIGGICTIKPTLGTPSTRGVIPISHNQDTVGPMARTVMDLAILLDAIVPQDVKPVESYAGCLLHKKRDKFRIGVLRYPFWDTSVLNSTNLKYQLPQLEEMLDSMKNSNEFVVLDPVVPTPEDLIRNISSDKEFIVLRHDFKHDINEYLRTEVISPHPIPPPSKSINYHRYFRNAPQRRIACLKDIIQFNEENPTPEGYNQELLVSSQATDGIGNRTYLELRDSNRRDARLTLDSILQIHDLDAIVTPSESRFEGFLDETLKAVPSQGYSVAAIAGYPSVNIPASIGLKGVPFGMTFIGSPHTECKLLEVAHSVEQMNPRRTLPKFLI